MGDFRFLNWHSCISLSPCKNRFSWTAEDVLSWQNSQPQCSQLVPVMPQLPVLTATAETSLKQHVKIDLNKELFTFIPLSFLTYFATLLVKHLKKP